MATYDSIGSGSLGNLAEVFAGMTINMAMAMARGLVTELTSTNISNFNKMNYDFMKIHMMRNAYEKIITLNTVGENAYSNGDGDATATPALYPSYTKGNNYMEFVTDAHDGSKRGEMTTRVQKAGEENKNLYLDDDNIKDDQVNFTGKYTDKNSILYKTKRLMRGNKLKTIISQFHTKGVEYNGQVGTKQFGESHGRNLLTKKAALGGTPYSRNGYDDPYCRVWTHHYKYDNLSKTMRSASTYEEDGEVRSYNMNVWDNFMWGADAFEGESDNHAKDETNYGVDGENYDYAWRGKHNQERRRLNSVLDPKSTGTNLVNITPKYLGGESKNIHTKSCMFSIENLAWKDYDPYSFEQALSWEQRGPFGGRIMWFPPYGIDITESSTAKWNTHEFIGRGEPVYTYVNTERTGTLSFLMLTDHPSSVDYASWWDDINNLTENSSEGREFGNAENDYLRYFAGCFDDEKDNKGDKTGGLHVTPPYMTDEYVKENPPILKPVEKKKEKPIIIQENTQTPPPAKITFNVYFPNNYSGVMDYPVEQISNEDNETSVDAILYLLAGRNAQKKNNKRDTHPNTDSPLSIESFESNDYSNFIGYEMGDKPITTNTSNTEYIVSNDKYTPMLWFYRVDHKQPQRQNLSVKTKDKSEDCWVENTNHQGDCALSNVLNQRPNSKITVWKKDLPHKEGNEDYYYSTDESSSGLNLKSKDPKNNIYSFAEVAAAIYKYNEDDNVYQYLIQKGVESKNVDTLYGYFTNPNYTVTSISCMGYANTQGSNKSSKINEARNTALAKNRGLTLATWLKKYFKNVDNEHFHHGAETEKNVTTVVDENESTDKAKLTRCATCTIEFSVNPVTNNEPVKTPEPEPQPESQDENDGAPEYVGFKFDHPENRPNGELWYYYKREGQNVYFEQEANGDNNYDENETTDIAILENSLHNIFESDDFKPTKELNIETYRGIYNKLGFYITNYKYEPREADGPTIIYMADDETTYPLKKDDYFYHDNVLYQMKKTPTEEGEEIPVNWEYLEPYLKDHDNDLYRVTAEGERAYYKKDDIVSQKDGEDNYTFYKCITKSFKEKYYTGHDFDKDKWDMLTPNIEDENYIVNYFINEYSFIGGDIRWNKYPQLSNVSDNVIINSFNENKYPVFYRTIGNNTFYEYYLVTGCKNPTKITRGGVDCFKKIEKWKRTKIYELNDYVIKDNLVYECIVNHSTPAIWDENQWRFAGNGFRLWDGTKYTKHSIYDGTKYYNPKDNKSEDVKSSYYECIRECYVQDTYNAQNLLTDVLRHSEGTVRGLVVSEESSKGEYDKKGTYLKDDVCLHIEKDKQLNVYYVYYRSTQDNPYNPVVEFSDEDWEPTSENDLYKLSINWELASIFEKVAALLCKSVKDTVYEYTGISDPEINSNDEFSVIWNYGEAHDLYTEPFEESVVLAGYASLLEETSLPATATQSSKIVFNEHEENYVKALIDTEKTTIKNKDLMFTYIVLHRILSGITKVKYSDGSIRDVCSSPGNNNSESLVMKTKTRDEYEYCDSEDQFWIDRGDHMLIQDCYIAKENAVISRDKLGDFNKVRYDQEYNFFKQYERDHPVMFEKLQKKLRYFNPAFHSMTPEGFNARCTFLQQCTRQGNTKTMSDLGGRTANNLAFGRAPYCVLRLGDFYYQMIVIDNVTFDFNVSEGLQWDLNPEGNGVQPMLCKVSLTFKFIGGGDITGPVQRLQNAMSFNYYANTSFYDNRADRIEYQPTNWATMGGAGNNKIDYKKSYSFIGKEYDDSDNRLIYDVKIPEP